MDAALAKAEEEQRELKTDASKMDVAEAKVRPQSSFSPPAPAYSVSVRWKQAAPNQYKHTRYVLSPSSLCVAARAERRPPQQGPFRAGEYGGDDGGDEASAGGDGGS